MLWTISSFKIIKIRSASSRKPIIIIIIIYYCNFSLGLNAWSWWVWWLYGTYSQYSYRLFILNRITWNYLSKKKKKNPYSHAISKVTKLINHSIPMDFYTNLNLQHAQISSYNIYKLTIFTILQPTSISPQWIKLYIYIYIYIYI